MKKAAILLPFLLAGGSLSSAEWEFFQGPEFDGIVKEKGLKSKSLSSLWTQNIKTGFSSFTISEGLMFSMGNEGDQDIVQALDVKTGKSVWKYSYAEPLNPKMYKGGPNATPTIEGDRVYTLSRVGLVHCFDAKKGSLIWKKDVREFGAKAPQFGFAGAPTILGDKVLLSVGDTGAALDKKNGEVIWSSKGKLAGYASVVPFDKETVLMLMAKELLGVDLKTGKVKFRHAFKAQYDINATTPLVVHGNKVLISNGYGTGRTALVEVKAGKVTQLWETTDLKSQFSNPAIMDGYIYGISGNTGKSCKVKCLKLSDGSVVWEKRSKFGSLRMADGKLYILDEKGMLRVVKADSNAYTELSSKKILKDICWTVPVISDGVLFARDAAGDVVAIDLKS
jgi:outer membrane protein assembly factor BamB